MEIISNDEINDTLEIDTTKTDSVKLTINHWNHWQEIELSPEGVELMMAAVGEWQKLRAEDLG